VKAYLPDKRKQPFKKGKREEVFYFTVCYDDQADLINEYQLMAHTAVLGSGKHRFSE
jgi:hypothetical protein